MSDVRKDKNLTTADLAGMRSPAETRPPAGAPAPREYSEEPRPKGAEAGPKPGPVSQPAGEPHPLFAGDETKRFRSEWDNIQIGFVDEPRKSVERADGLVANVMKRLAEVFAVERKSLEGQWDRGENVNTEDLRVALQRYRSFFDRLLSM
jgi:hypothetical protein